MDIEKIKDELVLKLLEFEKPSSLMTRSQLKNRIKADLEKKSKQMQEVLDAFFALMQKFFKEQRTPIEKKDLFFDEITQIMIRIIAEADFTEKFFSEYAHLKNMVPFLNISPHVEENLSEAASQSFEEAKYDFCIILYKMLTLIRPDQESYWFYYAQSLEQLDHVQDALEAYHIA